MTLLSKVLRGDAMTITKNRILLVDDEEVVLFAYTQLLSSPNVKIDLARNEQTALNLLDKNKYTAIISEFRFSGTTNQEGFEVIQKVRSTQTRCIILVVTGYGGVDVQKKVQELGADYYFEKPISPGVIKGVLQSHGAYL
jgi:DNA-binding response OmpR family regulator